MTPDLGHSPYRKTVGKLNSAQAVNLTNCDREQIHIPGLIQPYGILVCLDIISLKIEQISQNIESSLGRSVESLLGRPLSSLIPTKQFESLQDHIQTWDEDSFPICSFLDLKKKDGTSEIWTGHFHRLDNR